MSRKLENLPDASEEEILNLLRDQLNLQVTTQSDELKIDTLLNKFVERKWALLPCAKNDKNPIQPGWQKIENRSKSEWFHWINSGLNIGVRTGKVSNLCVIDLDFLSKEEKVELVKTETSENRKLEINAKKIIPPSIKEVMGEPLIQETQGGFHLFYQSSDLPKCAITIEGTHIDIEAEGGQVVIYPSPQTCVREEYKETPEGEVKKRTVGYSKRQWLNDNPIIPMPQNLYDLIKKYKVPTSPKTETPIEESSNVSQILNSDDVKMKDFTGNRNNMLVKLGGMFYKSMNISQVREVLDTVNRHIFESPLPRTEVDTVVQSLDKYFGGADTQIIYKILEYLKETDFATKQEISYVVFGEKITSEHKKRLDRILINLVRDKEIVKLNSRNYKIIRKMEVKKDFLKVGTPIDFKMPYFNDYAYFNKGDLILIGGTTKSGKTSLAMNIIQRLVKQGLSPVYIYNESGGRFGKTALALDLKPGEFGYTRVSDPMDVILEPNHVYIYDWIRPVDFAKTADIFDSLVQKLEDTNSIMIGFVQLRDNNDWFAKDLLRQFVSLSAKYLYLDDAGINTKLELNDIRDRKTNGKQYQILTKYIHESREVRTLEEIDEEDRSKQKGN